MIKHSRMQGFLDPISLGFILSLVGVGLALQANQNNAPSQPVAAVVSTAPQQAANR